MDGIVFQSTQRNNKGVNVVLFHHAANIEPRDLPDTTESFVSYGDGPPDDFTLDYSVYEEIPNNDEKEKEFKKDFGDLDFDLFDSDGLKEKDSFTLELGIHDISVYHLNNITYDTSEYKVERITEKKIENPDF